jgi:hypothetical protein
VQGPELTPLAEVLDRADLLIVGTPHDCYRGLSCRQPLIDITGTIKKGEQRSAASEQPAPDRPARAQ